jgi:membrane-bound lytic murein transglycosylase D
MFAVLLPMKISIRLYTILIFAMAYSSAFAQQGPKSDTLSRIGFVFQTHISADTAAVPVIPETPTFYNYNFVYKNRLDSIQKSIPLAYNEYVQKYIDIYSSRKDMIGKMLGLSSYYFPIFEQALKNYNVPDELKYLPVIESAMNPQAVSRVGATGLWQFMFSTARGYGLSVDNFVDERKDPIEASYAAGAYFRDAYAELGDWLLAIAAYNCGTGNVNRAIQKAGSRDFWQIRPFLPLETRNYVPAFIAAIYIMNCPKMHQIQSQQSSLALKTDTVQVSRFVSMASLAQALNMDESALCGLNPSYRKKIVNGTQEVPKRIIMPAVSLENYAMLYDVLNNSTVNTDMRVILASNDDRRLHRKGKGRMVSAVAYHKVGAGQNLSDIADRYHVEVQDLKVWNGLKGNTIVPGQKLIVSKHAAPLKGSTRATKGYISYRSGSSDRSGKL